MMNGFEDLVFEKREAAAIISDEMLAYDKLSAEEIWKDPTTFVNSRASVGAHLEMMERQSDELGVELTLNVDLIEASNDMDRVFLAMVTISEFAELCRGCPDEQGSIELVFDSVLDTDTLSSSREDAAETVAGLALFNLLGKNEKEKGKKKKKKKEKKKKGTK